MVLHMADLLVECKVGLLAKSRVGLLMEDWVGWLAEGMADCQGRQKYSILFA